MLTQRLPTPRVRTQNKLLHRLSRPISCIDISKYCRISCGLRMNKVPIIREGISSWLVAGGKMWAQSLSFTVQTADVIWSPRCLWRPRVHNRWHELLLNFNKNEKKTKHRKEPRPFFRLPPGDITNAETIWRQPRVMPPSVVIRKVALLLWFMVRISARRLEKSELSRGLPQSALANSWSES